MENTQTKRIHPLVAAAAGSVMLVSLLGAAAITGILPTSHSSDTPSATSSAFGNTGNPNFNPNPNQVASLNAANPTMAPQALATTTPQPAPQPAPRKTVPRHNTHNTNPGTAVASTKPVCDNCGTVVAVHKIEKPIESTSGVGVVAGAVLGGVLGNQVGGGNGRKLATVAGAIGGGYAGNEVEKRTRSQTSYEIKVKMENGTVRNFHQQAEPGFQSGDKVRVESGQLSSRA